MKGGKKDNQKCLRAGGALGPVGSEQKFASEGLTALRNCREAADPGIVEPAV